jgi:hypothetical protein
MPEQDERSPNDAAAVDAAISRVLQAEREAREAVVRCAREAEAIVEQARRQARQIARRSAHRAIRVQRWSASLLQRQLAAVAAQQAEIGPASALAEPGPRIRQAAERLAAELTGGSP